MQQLSEFVINHWILVTAFGVVAGLLAASLLNAMGGVSPQQAVMLINRDTAVVVDVRSNADFVKGHIIDAINIPIADLAEAPQRLRKHTGKQVLVVCASGTTSGAAVRQLSQAGFTTAQAIRGGIAAWRQDNLPLATG